jgi:hypothetical protein
MYGADRPFLYHAEGAPSGLLLIGLAVTNKPKNVYGFFGHGTKNGIYYLTFDESARTAQWLPAQQTSNGAISGLWGSDGGSLVVSRSADSAGEQAIHWTAPLAQ